MVAQLSLHRRAACGSALTAQTGGPVVLGQPQRNPPFRERLKRYLTAHRKLGACCYPTFFSGKEQHNCSGTDENLGSRPSASRRRRWKTPGRKTGRGSTARWLSGPGRLQH